MVISRTNALIIWAVGAIFYAYQYILRVMPNIMMDDILNQFNIDRVTFGQFSGVYYIGYSLMHLPIGIMLDRFGPKRVMPICILLTIIGLLPLIFSDFWIYPIIGRLLIGIGSSAAILGTFKIVRLAFVEAQFTRMLSLAVTVGLIGAIYGGGPLNYMCAELGYKSVIGIFVLLGIILAVITYLIVPNIEVKNTTSVAAGIKEVLNTPKVTIICILAGLMVGPMEGFADVWGTAFLKEVYGFENNISSSLPSIIFVGMCFGGPLLGLVAEKTSSYIGTIIASGIIMAISFLVLLTGNSTIREISFMFIAVGICSAYQIIAIYKASTYVNEHAVGLTTAITHMVIMIFGYFFHTVIGLVVNAVGTNDERLAHIYGVAVIPVALIIGTLGFIILALYERKQKKT